MPGQFEAFDLEPRLLQGIKDFGFDEMFPIQEEAIAPILEGRDVIGQAHTGSGKTLAYALPMLQRVKLDSPGIQGLVMVPTRELAVQVAGEFDRLARHLRVGTVAVYGGASIRPQIEKLRYPSSKVVVATPGRLRDHMERGTIRLNMVRFLVLDEADRMLDMGFIEDIEFVLRHVPRDHQTALFSATIPEGIVRLSQRFLNNPLRIFIDSDEMAVDSVEQRIIRVEENEKFPILCSLLGRVRISKGLVFCATKIRASRLTQALRANKFDAMEIHGDLSQNQRDQAIYSFRTGRTNLLVATEVAARGLDIPRVSHVINYDMPEVAGMYFHRIGRTARAGKTGVAVSFLSRDDEVTFSEIRRMTSASIDEIVDLNPRLGVGGPRAFLPPRPTPGGGRRFQGSRPRRRYDRRGRVKHRQRW